MKARVHSHSRWWWAWSFTTGYGLMTRRAYFERNEYEPGVRHLGVILLGCSFELRWSY